MTLRKDFEETREKAPARRERRENVNAAVLNIIAEGHLKKSRGGVGRHADHLESQLEIEDQFSSFEPNP